MFVESNLVLVARIIFFVSVAVFVGAALQGFPFLINFLNSVCILVQLFIIDFREGFRNEDPEDEPIHEE